MTTTAPQMIELVKLVLPKPPVLLELPVPEKSFPYLVGNPRKEGSILRWVEQPSPRGTVMTWGYDCSVDEIISDMISLIKERGEQENWGLNHISQDQAEKRMCELGISETKLVNQCVVPQDPSLLGSIIIVGAKKYPLIHNPSRGICFLSQK